MLLNDDRKGERLSRLSAELDARFGKGGPAKFFRAPGRVDLMGSHTDYNQGFILAATVSRDIVAAARPRPDGAINLYSLNTDLEVRVRRDDLHYDPRHGWANYAKGVIRELVEMKVPIEGLDLAVHGNVPVGGNLSSSAALEAAVCEAALGVTGADLPPWERVVLTRRAENVFMGLPCGVMDQFTVIMGQKNSAVLLDCHTLQYQAVPFFSDRAALVVLDSGQGRALVASKYHERVRECREAVKILAARRPGIKSLRDAALEDLEAAKAELGDVLSRRARHVVSENLRVRAAAEALQSSGPAALGQIMEQGYRSCRDDYENSTPNLDVLHDLAAAAPGVFGVRICGAGWGGCLLALAEPARAETAIAGVLEQYRVRAGVTGQAWTVVPDAGAGAIA